MTIYARAEQLLCELDPNAHFNGAVALAIIEAALRDTIEDCANEVMKQLEVPLPNETVEIVQHIAAAIRALK